MLRMRDGRFDKDDDLTPISWDQAFDIMVEKWKAPLKKDSTANPGKPPEKITSKVPFGSFVICICTNRNRHDQNYLYSSRIGFTMGIPPKH